MEDNIALACRTVSKQLRSPPVRVGLTRVCHCPWPAHQRVCSQSRVTAGRKPQIRKGGSIVLTAGVQQTTSGKIVNTRKAAINDWFSD